MWYGLLRQYSDLPMGFADAALVRVAERDGLKRILTSTHTSASIACPVAVVSS